MSELLKRNTQILSNNLHWSIYSAKHSSLNKNNDESIELYGNKSYITSEIILLFMNSNWDDNLATGISNIDSQNKEIFLQINNLLFNLKQEKSKIKLIKELDCLEKYVIKHFNEEEAIQKQNEYPKYNLQHDQHEVFKNDLKKLRNILESKELSASIIVDIYEKIFKVYRKHIINLDKDLGMFLLAKFRG
ncbi:hypothetical protein psyc5s11_03790 [Clostridium gelidum]|uniref:Hemerythrin-like domain-containing protein n=1 Tax=Clostridium gelidum TaxID=704125 RepID=A0ABM7T072_9CLOT|nr:hemerythrin domain-containing protein [Clostridium gelidum]BCZ44312.1 hypothetical protein psyc5s11_03790 [Clostridium gelidum]